MSRGLSAINSGPESIEVEALQRSNMNEKFKEQGGGFDK
jgi:hypothetical protein